MNWREDETLVHIREGSIEVLPLVHWSVKIVLAVHHVEIILESLLYLFDDVALRGIWVDWFSPFPVVLVSLVKETMVSNSIARHFVDVLHLVCVLVHATPFVKEFLVLSVIKLVVL